MNAPLDAPGENLLCAMLDSDPVKGFVEGDTVGVARLTMNPHCTVAKLPLEMLTIIFHCALDDDGDAPLVLGGVCKHWRHIVHNTPAFWLHLSLRFHNPRGKAWLWLRRSRYRVRDLTLCGVAACQAFKKHRDEKRFDSLVSLAVFPLSDANYFDFASISWWTHIHLPNLTSFKVAVDDDADTAVWFRSQDKDPLARLLHLHLSAQIFEFSGVPRMPLLQTLVLDMKRAQRERNWRGPCAACSFEQMLRCSPLLEDLTLRGALVETCVGRSTTPLVLARLRVLRLAGWFTTSATLNILRTPALEELHVAPAAAGSALTVLRRFAAPAADFAHLRVLRIAALRAADTPLALTPLLLQMPRLAELQLARSAAALGPLLRALAPLPALEALDLAGCARVDVFALLALVYAHVPPGDMDAPPRVRRLVLDCGPEFAAAGAMPADADPVQFVFSPAARKLHFGLNLLGAGD